MMQKIIEAIDPSIIEKELSAGCFLRKTNNAQNEIYLFNHHNAPNTLLELGRLREITFRSAGGGTGKKADIDEFDTMDEPFQQLIVWSPTEREIVGGYRYIHGKKLLSQGSKTISSPTLSLFSFSDQFIEEYLPYTIELGRSFVQPNFQPSYGSRKGIFSLDNLWDGLGALTLICPDIKHFFGKFTMYPSFNSTARDILMAFLHRFFPDHNDLIVPIVPLQFGPDWKSHMDLFAGEDYKEDYKTLVRSIRELDENVPPLVNAYMNLSSTMKTFGTSLNDHFGEVEETGILVTIADIYDAKTARHIDNVQLNHDHPKC